MRTRLLFTAATLTVILASAACNRAAQITGPREPTAPARADGTPTDERGPNQLGGGG
jgi:hypothetical protein